MQTYNIYLKIVYFNYLTDCITMCFKFCLPVYWHVDIHKTHLVKNLFKTPLIQTIPQDIGIILFTVQSHATETRLSKY
jgi:hypothetical protein